MIIKERYTTNTWKIKTNQKEGGHAENGVDDEQANGMRGDGVVSGDIVNSIEQVV